MTFHSSVTYLSLSDLLDTTAKQVAMDEEMYGI